MQTTREMLDALTIVAQSDHLSADSLRNLSVTAKSVNTAITLNVADELCQFQAVKFARMTNYLLAPRMKLGDAHAKKLANLVITNIACIDDSIDRITAERLLEAVHSSGYDREQHYKIASINAALFGKHKILNLLIQDGFPAPTFAYTNIKNKFQNAMRANHFARAENYRETMKLLIDVELRLILEMVKSRIKEHQFELKGGGDQSIAEIGRPISSHAAAVYKAIDLSLNSKTSLIESFDALAKEIISSLGTNVKKGWFTSYGERAPSTTVLYTKIIIDINNGKSLLTELQQSIQKAEHGGNDSDNDDQLSYGI